MAIIHDKQNQRFTMEVSGKTAKVDYMITAGKMHLIYSEVPVELRGRGIGRQLVEGTFEKLTEEGYSAVPVCSFIRSVARKSAKWNSLIG